MKYLKDKQYYIDRYDRITVGRCRRLENNYMRGKSLPDPKDKLSNHWKKTAKDVALYFYTGEEYSNKEATIREWMEKDERRDNFLENAEQPVEVSCKSCCKPMIFELKSLHGHDDEHVIFFYRCNSCKKGRAFFETGEEYIPDEPKCPKCGNEFTKSTKKENAKLIIIRHCDDCGFNDDYVYDDVKIKEKPDPDYEKDRKRFCLTEAEGKSHLEAKFRLESVSKLLEENEKKEVNKPLYGQLEKMQKLTVVQLKQLLEPALEKAGYTSLVFSEPKMDRHVIIAFTAEDSKADRTKYDSEHELKRLIKKLLENANWNLMTDSPHYRMGVLTGQLKGLESEEDLLNKIRQRKPLPGTSPVTK